MVLEETILPDYSIVLIHTAVKTQQSVVIKYLLFGMGLAILPLENILLVLLILRAVIV